MTRWSSHQTSNYDWDIPRANQGRFSTSRVSIFCKFFVSWFVSAFGNIGRQIGGSGHRYCLTRVAFSPVKMG